jgi:hypothetical protein
MTFELKPIVIYRRATGEIVSNGSITFHDEFRDNQISAALVPWGEDDYALGEFSGDPAANYIGTVGGETVLLERPPVPYQIDKTTIASGGTDFATITGLHNPCEIVVDDPDPTVETTVYVVEDGGFEFAADVPGLYTIEVRHFPFVPMKLEVTAT